MKTENYLKEIAERAIDRLNDLIESEIYGCDLHNEIFNTDYYIYGTYRAEQWLIDGPGVFSAIGEIQEYETDNFGEVNTDLSIAEKVVNMFVYIKGEEILNNSKTLLKKWDEQLSKSDYKKIIKEIKKKYQGD